MIFIELNAIIAIEGNAGVRLKQFFLRLANLKIAQVYGQKPRKTNRDVYAKMNIIY